MDSVESMRSDVALETKDKFHTKAVLIEFGFSTYVVGGSKLQMQAWKNGKAYERKATAIGPISTR